MICKVLMENTSAHEGIYAEHGLSLYLETINHKILFDAGQTDAFAKNAQDMNVDLTAVDIAILSHGHYDHSGGWKRFREINPYAPLYLNQYAAQPHFSGERAIGIDQTILQRKPVISIKDEHYIDEELTIVSANNKIPSYIPIGANGLNMLEYGKMIPDDFRHEQYLLIHEANKRILVSGCSHKGILNIMEWYQPDIFIGGFHLKDLQTTGADGMQLNTIAEKLNKYQTVYYTGHCTGTEQFAVLKETMGNKLHYAAAGDTFSV